jgi:hypothetical protein
MSIEISAIEVVLTTSVQKLIDICEDRSSNKKDKSCEQLSGYAQSIQDTQRQIKIVCESKSSLYDQYCDEVLTRCDYIRLRDVEDKILARLNTELSDFERLQAELYANPYSEMSEHINGVKWDGIITREVTEALLKHIAVYAGGIIEIEWMFNDPFANGTITEL